MSVLSAVFYLSVAVVYFAAAATIWNWIRYMRAGSDRQ
jgi:hypothetical protein